MLHDKYDAFMDDHLTLNPTGSGKLDNLTFAVKDVFAIEGHTNTAGNPDWLRTHKPSEVNAAVIDQLIKTGARMIGTTHTDELMYSLNGENHHYGTPINPKAPDHIPGGSSSGSAVAVSAGLVDFALGTDTGGSVRIPSSYCGLYGIRPTHGDVSIDGVIPLAKSFDTVGWMTNSPDLLKQVGDVVLTNQADTSASFTKILYAEDAWSQLLDDETKHVFSEVHSLLKNSEMEIESVTISEEGLAVWAEAFRVIQGAEIWREHGQWVEVEKPSFGPGIAERFEMASKVEKQGFEEKCDLRKKIRSRISSMLGKGGILVIPTAPGIAPLRGLPSKELDDYRARAMRLTCIAGLSGLPQVTIPVAEVNGKPIGLSFLANHHMDKKLIDFAVKVVGNHSSVLK